MSTSGAPEHSNYYFGGCPRRLFLAAMLLGIIGGLLTSLRLTGFKEAAI